MRNNDLGWKPGADTIVKGIWYTAQGLEHALTSTLITADDKL
jgi:hypothetical protein